MSPARLDLGGSNRVALTRAGDLVDNKEVLGDGIFCTETIAFLQCPPEKIFEIALVHHSHALRQQTSTKPWDKSRIPYV